MEHMIAVRGVKKGFSMASGDTFWALKGLDMEKGTACYFKRALRLWKNYIDEYLKRTGYAHGGGCVLSGDQYCQNAGRGAQPP